MIYLAGLASAAAGDGASHPRSIVAFGALAGIPAALALWVAFFPAAAPGLAAFEAGLPACIAAEASG